MTAAPDLTAANRPERVPSMQERVEALAGEWLDGAAAGRDRRQRRRDQQLARLLADPAGLRFAMAFIDRVMRAPDPGLQAALLHALVTDSPPPAFLGGVDRAMLRLGAHLAPLLPRPVMALAVRRMRSLTAHLVLPAQDAKLHRHLVSRRRDGWRVNVNLLGEAMLGDDEAAERLALALELIARPDVDYVSVKISALSRHLDVLAFEPRARTGRRPAAHALPRRGGRPTRRVRQPRHGGVPRPPSHRRRVPPGARRARVRQASMPASCCRPTCPTPTAALDELLAWAAAAPRAGGGGGQGAPRQGRQPGHGAGRRRAARLAAGAVRRPRPRSTPTTSAMLDRAFDAPRTGGLLDRRGQPQPVRRGLGARRSPSAAASSTGSRSRCSRAWPRRSRRAGPRRRRRPAALHAGRAPTRTSTAAIAYLFRRLEENAAPENFLRHAVRSHPAQPPWDASRPTLRGTPSPAARPSAGDAASRAGPHRRRRGRPSRGTVRQRGRHRPHRWPPTGRGSAGHRRRDRPAPRPRSMTDGGRASTPAGRRGARRAAARWARDADGRAARGSCDRGREVLAADARRR